MNAMIKMKGLRHKANLLQIKLYALQERCRHPSAEICHSSSRTWCAACDQTFWPRSTFFTHKANLSEEELLDITTTRGYLELELRKLRGKIEQIEKACPHPLEKLQKSEHPDYGDTCGECGREF